MNRFMGVAVAIVLGIAQVPSCYGWWDNGHMLIGEVANQLLAPEDRASIQAVLQKWEADFPNTSSIATAAIWSDLIKCSKNAPYCPSPATPSLTMMDPWHYINIPLNINGTKYHGREADLELIKLSFDGSILDVLEKSINSFNTMRSIWAANLVLRNFIHAFGDLHQPMHTVGGVSERNPRGDLGGNLYKFRSPCAFSNLHALWDSAGGEYVVNWAPDTSTFKNQLETNASALAAWSGAIPDGINFDQFKEMSYNEFATNMVSNTYIRKVALETYDIAQDIAYKNLDLVFDAEGKVACPPDSYAQWASFISKLRLTLGGKRLSVVLTHFARQIRALGLAA
jgi:hypothetical protein